MKATAIMVQSSNYTHKRWANWFYTQQRKN